MAKETKAKHEIASAVEDAKKAIANAAAEALKVQNAAISGDHDLLIRIETILNRVVEDVAELKTNTVARIDKIEIDYITKAEHEKVVDDIVALKNWKNWLLGSTGIASAIIIFLAVAFFNHLTAK